MDSCFSEEERERLCKGEHNVKDFGDGAYWIERLLDRIAGLSPGHEAAIEILLTRARQPFNQSAVRLLRLESFDSSATTPVVNADCMQDATAAAAALNPLASVVLSAGSSHDQTEPLSMIIDRSVPLGVILHSRLTKMVEHKW